MKIALLAAAYREMSPHIICLADTMSPCSKNATAWRAQRYG